MLSKNNIENVMQIPKFNQININTGVGKGAVIDRKHLIGALFTLEFITGQKPSITRAKKSIDKFKLREKMLIGCKVTLRKKKMSTEASPSRPTPGASSTSSSSLCWWWPWVTSSGTKSRTGHRKRSGWNRPRSPSRLPRLHLLPWSPPLPCCPLQT